jgi:hypothetical protein
MRNYLRDMVEKKQPSPLAKKRERHRAAVKLAERIDETCESYLRALSQSENFYIGGLPGMENILIDTEEILHAAISKMTTEQIIALDSLMQLTSELRREEVNLKCLKTH